MAENDDKPHRDKTFEELRDEAIEATTSDLSTEAAEALRKVGAPIDLPDVPTAMQEVMREARLPTDEIRDRLAAMTEQNQRAIDEVMGGVTKAGQRAIDEAMGGVGGVTADLPVVAEQVRLSESLSQMHNDMSAVLDEEWRARVEEEERVRAIEEQRLEREAEMLALTGTIVEQQQSLVQKQTELLEEQRKQGEAGRRNTHLTIWVLVVTTIGVVAGILAAVVGLVSL